MRIEKVVGFLCRKYQSRNPFEIAKGEGIIISDEPLGNIRGYYNKAFRQRMIHLNQNLEDEERFRTCAHELGHGILHPKSSTPFLRARTLFPIGRYETEADRFAVDLLYSDEDLKKYLQFSSCQIAEFLKLPLPLIEYRLDIMEKQLKISV
jgi:Zn-dependent peptidase ImmA (M78 family)